MKRIVTNKRICFYDVLQEKVVAMMAELFSPDLDDEIILRVSFNPQLMD